MLPARSLADVSLCASWLANRLHAEQTQHTPTNQPINQPTLKGSTSSTRALLLRCWFRHVYLLFCALAPNELIGQISRNAAAVQARFPSFLLATRGYQGQVAVVVHRANSAAVRAIIICSFSRLCAASTCARARVCVSVHRPTRTTSTTTMHCVYAVGCGACLPLTSVPPGYECRLSPGVIVDKQRWS